VINLREDETFPAITDIRKLVPDPRAHAAYVQQVARHARRMRDFFERMGLRYEPQRFRVRGRCVDRTRLQGVILRGDPRMLVARELRVRTDLFLGVLVDCSSSMTMNNRIERAKLFAVLLAEAAKGLRGIDVRVLGFTHGVIYDAGTARHCAAHALEAEGGNNDAAALWHGAQLALRSRRKAKLLVMISDGSPTECSVAALRALVGRLSRRAGICCAQVAVRAIDEVCFPHYVEIESKTQGEAVRQFGRVIMRLVQKAIGGA
jgi:Mg-chelatase subunit ChlD